MFSEWLGEACWLKQLKRQGHALAFFTQGTRTFNGKNLMQCTAGVSNLSASWDTFTKKQNKQAGFEVGIWQIILVIYPFFPFKIYVHLVSVHTLLFRSNLNHVFEKFQGQNIHNCHCKLDTKGHTCYVWKGIITILFEVTQNSQWIIVPLSF